MLQAPTCKKHYIEKKDRLFLPNWFFIRYFAVAQSFAMVEKCFWNDKINGQSVTDKGHATVTCG